MGRKPTKKPGKKPKKDKDDDVKVDKIGRVRKKSQSHAGKKIGTWTEEEMNAALTQLVTDFLIVFYLLYMYILLYRI